MSALDSSLDDIIAARSASGRRGGPAGRRPATGVVRGGRPAPTRNTRTTSGAARQRSAPYARNGGRRGAADSDHLADTDLRDVAASSNPLLKVSSASVAKNVAGAICNVVRESATNDPPNVMATGPGAINQAIKAIAIAKKYLLDEDQPLDLVVQPRFEQDLREGSNVTFLLKKVNKPIGREPTDEDLSAKDGTDCFKLAGAIAGRVRDGEEVNVTVKGSVPVLVAVKALALAQDYLAEDSIDIKFAVQFRDMEEMGQTSTFLHFAILARKM